MTSHVLRFVNWTHHGRTKGMPSLPCVFFTHTRPCTCNSCSWLIVGTALILDDSDESKDVLYLITGEHRKWADLQKWLTKVVHFPSLSVSFPFLCKLKDSPGPNATYFAFLFKSFTWKRIKNQASNQKAKRVGPTRAQIHFGLMCGCWKLKN